MRKDTFLNKWTRYVSLKLHEQRKIINKVLDPFIKKGQIKLVYLETSNMTF